MLEPSRGRRGGDEDNSMVDGAGTPLEAYLDAASPAEVTLLAQASFEMSSSHSDVPSRGSERSPRGRGA